MEDGTHQMVRTIFNNVDELLKRKIIKGLIYSSKNIFSACN